jgi:hypothetical protein
MYSWPLAGLSVTIKIWIMLNFPLRGKNPKKEKIALSVSENAKRAQARFLNK